MSNNLLYLGRSKLDDYFPAFKNYITPSDIGHNNIEHPEVVRAKYFIQNEFKVNTLNMGIL